MKKSFLSIETSLNRIFLVLHFKDKLTSKTKTLEKSIEVEINQMLYEILEKVGADFSDIDYIMVSMGPGSYTGTRVGLATAKAISVSINIPIFGYTNFNAIFYQGIIDRLINKESSVGILIKASKYDFYYQQFKENKSSKYKVLNINSFNGESLTSESFLGSYKKISELKNYSFCLPKKESVLKIFLKYLENNGTNNYLEPLYIKGHYAENR